MVDQTEQWNCNAQIFNLTVQTVLELLAVELIFLIHNYDYTC